MHLMLSSMLNMDARITTYVTFLVISGFVLILYNLYPMHNDLERSLLNNKDGKCKYYLLLYAKYILIFAFIYNLKYLLITHLNKS